MNVRAPRRPGPAELQRRPPDDNPGGFCDRGEPPMSDRRLPPPALRPARRGTGRPTPAGPGGRDPRTAAAPRPLLYPISGYKGARP